MLITTMALPKNEEVSRINCRMPIRSSLKKPEGSDEGGEIVAIDKVVILVDEFDIHVEIW